MNRMMLALLLGVTGCDLDALTREDLFGPITPVGGDAAPPLPGSDAEAPETRPDASAPDQPRQTAPLSGQVVNKCTGEAIDAQIGYAGRHTCSITGKGSYYFIEAPVGMTLAFTAYKKGYKPYSQPLEVVSRGTVVNVALEPEGGCAMPRPATEACVCTLPSCTPS